MLKNKSKGKQILSIEDLVPQNHILRDIDRAIDLDFIYEEVEDLYCHDNGRPTVYLVVLFKSILIQYMFGIQSMCQTIKEIEVIVKLHIFLVYNTSKSN